MKSVKFVCRTYRKIKIVYRFTQIATGMLNERIKIQSASFGSRVKLQNIQLRITHSIWSSAQWGQMGFLGPKT